MTKGLLFVAAATLSATLCHSAASAADGGKAAAVAGDGIPVSPREAVGRMAVPDGFRVTLFAGEPDVVQPIAFCFDDRGRLWVAESHTYPDWQRDLSQPGRDRILIFEDKDHDGAFDERKVFAEGLVNISGIELGFGGVYVCATPRFIFIPDRNADDKPDGAPVVLLDGWNLEKAGHNVFNGLTWGPDGWLWGLNGIQSDSRVGKPGTPDGERVAINCGVWRWHPTRHVFEAVAHGTTNPWGLDFDDYGQAFMTNCVIGHLWHVIPGARYKRMYGEDFNKHAYGLMEGCADHLHWAGKDWTKARAGQGQNEYGGGHAHVGAMVYLGDNWPDAYRNGLFTCNLHGNRVNHDVPEPKGSGYVHRHGKDFLLANDTWFRGLELAYGPDGGVYLTDWNDTGECHDTDDVVRESGRIFKVTYGAAAKKADTDVARLDDAALVELQLHRNDWFVQHARRVLQERAAVGKLSDSVEPALRKVLGENPDVTRQLRALWALHAIDALRERDLLQLMSHPHEYVRGWAVRLELEDRAASPAVAAKLAELAASDPSPVVRLHLASALQRLPLEQRWPVAEGLVAHDVDATDANLPLMVWYGVEPLVPADRNRAVKLMAQTKIPLVREYTARRLAGK